MPLSVRRSHFLAGGLAAAATAAGTSRAVRAAALVPVRLSINAHFFSYLPIFTAVDRGYFRAAGIDLQIARYTGSANSQLGFLATGQLDITPVVAGPALFNQAAQGFGAKLVAAIAGAKSGYHGTSVLVVRKDVWDAGTIRKPADLRGKRLDGAALGSPVAFLAMNAVRAAGLQYADLTYTVKEAAPSDQLTALLNRAVDVQGTTEPTATAMEAKGYGVRWLGYGEVIPWFQETYFGVAAGFLREHPDVVERFLTAYLRGVRDVARSGPRWDAAEIATVAKWSETDAADVERIGGPPYVGAFGEIDRVSLERTQRFWVDEKLVHEPVSVALLVDDRPLRRARRSLHLQ